MKPIIAFVAILLMFVFKIKPNIPKE